MVGSLMTANIVKTQAGPTCEPCRARKVRCNRKTPCSHCTRLHLSCVYKTRKRRSPLTAPAQSSPESSSPPTIHGAHEASDQSNNIPSDRHVLDRLTRVEAQLSDLIQFLKHEKATNNSPGRSQGGPAVLIPPVRPSRDAPMDRGNYVDNSVFFEVLLNGSAPHDVVDSKAPPNGPSLSIQRPSTQYGIVATDVFGDQFDDPTIPSSTYRKLWSFYATNFDPLIKVLHLPSMGPLILGACSKPEEASDSTMSLVYAASFAAVTTLSRQECIRALGFDQRALLRSLMQNMDDALGRARLLLRPNIHTLTALVIYLAALRTHDASRTVWTITGLAIRIAESLGVHEDGSRLGLGPFETEMRRRLWSHLTSLDYTAPENHGFYSTALDRNYTIMLPTNTDDVDLSPHMVEDPAERSGWSDMTFSILNIDVLGQLTQALVSNRRDGYETKKASIRSIEREMNRRWRRFVDPMKPICHAADAWVHISILKAEFVLALQQWLSDIRGTNSKYSDLPQPIFIMAIELLEYGHLLQSGELFEPFVWFFQQYPQLYALFLVLRTLCASPRREGSERAWSAVEDYFACLTDFELASEMRGRTSCVWAVLGPLRIRARESYTQAHRDEFSAGPLKPTLAEYQDLSPLGNEFDLQPSSYALDQLGDLSDFDNALAWQDFPEWFSMQI